jgi:hypothetical protein
MRIQFMARNLFIFCYLDRKFVKNVGSDITRRYTPGILADAAAVAGTNASAGRFSFPGSIGAGVTIGSLLLLSKRPLHRCFHISWVSEDSGT